ncbi:flagellar filament capping protein FliD [Polymorphobacter sp. PAMC 29334]|uniref:flagellar filament capping protein FliD n=1 Tax=Polymorphobacter sp. PAMC 29334 TaxID=2862331 RepID=UPI001C7581EE|nr:flagellar filament capping protein FliD [Polymorphobacter sp. PAMC 29334]QYE34479.1 flagellar filament capping protein FliD [Polymorphobacter sp. PAMC 29334]
MTSILTTLGVGSGLDTTALIDALVKAQHDPRDTALTTRSTVNDARVSGVSQVNSGLSGLITALSSRTVGGALGPLPSSSDPTVVAASATSGATPSLDPIDIVVNALAAGQTLVAATVASPAAPVGLGTLTLTFGTATSDGQGGFGFAGGSAAPITVTIDPTNNSLTGLRDAINAAQKGNATAVVASIIADSTGARLVLKGPGGAASAFIVADPGASADGVADNGLNRFVYTPAASTMTVAATAHDASLTVDGIAITRPTNHFSDLIDGVTLDLRKASPGTTVTIAATRDGDGLKSAIRDLVAALNAVGATAKALTHTATTSDPAGALVGDATMRRFEQQLAALTSSVTGSAVAGVPSLLADLGITTARDGTLSVDETRLGAAVAAFPDAVEKILVGLTTNGATKGALTALAADFAAVTKTGDASNRYARETTAIASDRATLDARMTTYRATLVTQYAAMEAAVAASKSTQAFLDEQIKAWNQTTN